MQGSFIVSGLQECSCDIFLLKKTAITWEKMTAFEKKFKLVLKTTGIYKKVFLQYQAKARFPSLW